MAKTSVFVEHKNQAYVTTANTIAAESGSTPSHAERIAIAKQLAVGGGNLDWYISNTFNALGYDDQTSVGDMCSYLMTYSIPNIIALGL